MSGKATARLWCWCRRCKGKHAYTKRTLITHANEYGMHENAQSKGKSVPSPATESEDDMVSKIILRTFLSSVPTYMNSHAVTV